MIALVDERIDATSLLALKNMGAELFLMPPADFLQRPVASHPDMLVFIGYGRIFCHRRYYEANKKLLDNIITISRLELSLSDEEINADYPNDVKFNAALVGSTLICNKKTVSSLILDAAVSAGHTILNIPQGYTKCSTCVVSDNAIITSDRPIYDACLSCDIDALLIGAGNITLPNYDYGFIGGTSGAYGDKVLFCGDILLHPDGKSISDFCKKHGKSAISLSSQTLFDIGTIMLI